MTLLDLLTRLLGVDAKLDSILALLQEQGAKMSAQLDNLTAQVERTTTVTDSVLTLVKGLADQLQAAKDDPAKVQALADALRSDADRLEQAVTTNTPAQPGGGGGTPAQPQPGAAPGTTAGRPGPHPHPPGSKP